MRHLFCLTSVFLLAVFVLGCVGDTGPMVAPGELVSTVQPKMHVPHTHDFGVRVLDTAGNPIQFLPVFVYYAVNESNAIYIDQTYTDNTGVATFRKGRIYVGAEYLVVYPLNENQSSVTPTTIYDGLIVTLKNGTRIYTGEPEPINYTYTPHTHDYAIRAIDSETGSPIANLTFMAFSDDTEVSEVAISDQLYVEIAETDELGYARFTAGALKTDEYYNIATPGIEGIYYPAHGPFFVEDGKIENAELTRIGEFIPLELKLEMSSENICKWSFHYGNQADGIITGASLKVAPDLFQTMEGNEIIEISLFHDWGDAILDNYKGIRIDQPLVAYKNIQPYERGHYELEIIFDPSRIEEDDGPIRLCMDDLNFDKELWSWGADGQCINIPIPCSNITGGENR